MVYKLTTSLDDIMPWTEPKTVWFG